MDKETLEKYRKAGEIAAKVREFGKDLIEEEASYFEVVESTEDKIKELGAKPAFPVNLSVNEVGAHDTAGLNEERKLGGGLVKLDVGVQVDGFIGDTAVTVSLNREERLVEAVEEALGKALKLMKPSNKVKEVSAKIEDTIRSYDYNPVKNLTGHGLDRYDLHAKLEFPNVKNDINYELKEGDVFALEPFATNGAGKVRESDKTLIYRWQADKSVRSREGRKILKMAKDDFKKLPFAKRWLTEKVSKLRLNLALQQLLQRNALYKYPVLREADGGDIAQAEHTVIVQEEPKITTSI